MIYFKTILNNRTQTRVIYNRIYIMDIKKVSKQLHSFKFNCTPLIYNMYNVL